MKPSKVLMDFDLLFHSDMFKYKLYNSNTDFDWYLTRL